MAKITMQDIADSLQISRATVCKAFNNHKGISDSLKQQIFRKAKEMGYNKFNIEKDNEEAEEKTVSLIVSRPDSSTFWTNIIHRLAQELSLHNINLLYTYMPTLYSPDFTLPSILKSDVINGAIILNISDGQIISEINKLSIPKVFLDTVPTIWDQDLNGDLILLEGYATIYKITESIIKKGKKDIGFIGDINFAKTNYDRFSGFKACMNEKGLPLQEKYIMTKSIDILSYKETITKYLDSLDNLPECFICISDYVAHFVKEYVSEHQERVPNGIILTGYDGSKEYSNVEGLLTTADVNTTLIGKRLAIQIIYRMEHEEAPYELTYIKPEIIYRDNIIYN